MRLFMKNRRISNWCSNIITRRISKKLKLDKQQQTQLIAVKNRMYEAHHDIHETKQVTHNNIEALLNSEQFDRDMALQLFQSTKERMLKKLPDMIDSFADFYNNLNNSQREQVQKMWLKKQHHCH